MLMSDMKEENSKYKDLVVWQKSMTFANDVINVVETLNTTRYHYRLCEQLEAASTSIPMNITEGKGRNTNKEFICFLHIARGIPL